MLPEMCSFADFLLLSRDQVVTLVFNFWALFICLQTTNLRIKGFGIRHQALNSLIPLLFSFFSFLIFVHCSSRRFFFPSLPFPSAASLQSALGCGQLKYLSRSVYIQREHFLNHQNPLELFKVSPFLGFPIFFSLTAGAGKGHLAPALPDPVPKAGGGRVSLL